MNNQAVRVAGRPRDHRGHAAGRSAESGRIEVLVGRGAAACVHPILAWRRSSRPRRCAIAGAYLALGYLTTLTALYAL